MVLSIFLFNQNGFGQLDYPLEFKETLQAAQLDFYEPLENSAKIVQIQKNDLLPYDFALKLKKEKVEIRYAILPDSEQKEYFRPNIYFAAKASSVASNDEDSSIMAFHAVDTAALKNTFNAEWGAAVFFKPKASFSSKQHCKMLALYKEGKANVLIFYLFNDESIDLNEPQFQNIRFADIPEN